MHRLKATDQNVNSVRLSFPLLFFKFCTIGSSHCGEAETNQTRTCEDAGLIRGLAQWVGDPALP